MHERERHRIILSAVQEKPVITIQDLVELTEASEATLRRDIASLHMQGRIKRVRGGAEAIHPPQFASLTGRPFKVSESENADRKRAIAREAVALCDEGRHHHHQWRLHDFPDGALSCPAPLASADQFLRHCRTFVAAVEEHGDCARRRDLSRPEPDPFAFRQ
jgi:hypothetical protein